MSDTSKFSLSNESTRAWIYRITTAVLLLLTGLGVVTDSQVPLYLGLAGAVLNTGMAARNTTP